MARKFLKLLSGDLTGLEILMFSFIRIQIFECYDKELEQITVLIFNTKI